MQAVHMHLLLLGHSSHEGHPDGASFGDPPLLWAEMKKDGCMADVSRQLLGLFLHRNTSLVGGFFHSPTTYIQITTMRVFAALPGMPCSSQFCFWPTLPLSCQPLREGGIRLPLLTGLLSLPNNQGQFLIILQTYFRHLLLGPPSNLT